MTTGIFTTLISVDETSRRLDDPGCIVLDARYRLNDPEYGRRAYAQGHVPGARYVHLHDDLSGPPLTDHGRHPLPAPEALNALFRRLGINDDSQVIAYDDADGSIAARVWWLLRYMGHDAVAVMDGGFRAWSAAGHGLQSESPRATSGAFHGSPRRDWLVTLDAVPAQTCLVDARAGARYRGEDEPLDPVAGHIPGARSHPFAENVQQDGRFRPAGALRARFEKTLAGHAPETAVYYCGSGVTACHLLLAAAHAGLPPGRLYAGSWSEWCADPDRPVARGPDPGSMPRP